MRDAMKTTGLLTVILIIAITLMPLCAGEAGGLYGCVNAAEEKTTVSAMDEGAVSESTASEENPSPDAGSANTENTLSSKSAAGAGATLGAVGSLTVYLYGHDDIKAKWSRVNGAAGYRVYYKKSTSKTWSSKSTADSYCKIANLTDGCKYMIKVIPYTRDSGGTIHYSRKIPVIKDIYTLKRLMTPTVSRTGLERVNVSWNNIPGETGYQISRSSSKTGTYIISTYKTISGRSKPARALLDRQYYYKVRAYRDYGSLRVYGPWSYVRAYKTGRNYYPKATRLEKDGKWFNLRTLSGQRLYEYDILQGSCTDGKYGYYVLYNKKTEKCKIVKVRLSDLEIIRVSGILGIHHGNSLAYNSSTKKIAAVHMSGYSKRIAIINPDTLRLEKNKDIDVPLILKGASIFQTRAIEGFNAIAYDAANMQYILRIRKTGNFLVTDKYLNPVRHIVPNVKMESGRIYAGIGMINGYIASEQASSNTGTFSRYNIVRLYSREGKYAGCINIRKGYELESVFYTGGFGYAAFYHSYNLNGKLMRNNYIYRFPI